MSDLALSVVVPCFNLERYIEPCLDSLSPVGRAGQIIVVDDGSSDSSAERIRAWAQRYDGRVDTIFHPTNRGAPVAFNAGLARASEALICYVDGDDTVDAEALRRQARVLTNASEDVVVVYGDLDRIDAAGRSIEGRTLDWIRSVGGPFEGDVRAALVRYGSICPLLGTTMRTRDLVAAGELDESLGFCDWPLWLTMALTGSFRYSGEVVGQYRQHADSMSLRRRNALDADRLYILSGLARRNGYHEQQSEIAIKTAQVVASMRSRGIRPSLPVVVGLAARLGRPRLVAHALKGPSWSTRRRPRDRRSSE